MNKEKEKEQLLQDASTLLMFANVARQGLGLPGDSPTNENQSSSPRESGRPQASNGHTPAATSAKNSPSQVPTKSPDSHTLQPLIPRSPNQPTRSPPQLRHGSWNTPLGNVLSRSLPGGGILPPSIPSRGYFTYPYSGSAPYPTLPSLQQVPSQNLQPAVPGIGPQQTPHFQSSGLKKAQPDIKQQSTDASKITRPPSEPKPQSNLPAQGSFQTHRRSISGGYVAPRQSPGPANIALSRGIDVDSGKRSTDNAVIAAAALAAAADIPFPLKRNQEIQNQQLRKEEDTKEDSIMTEPEDDNKTDDETIPQNTPRVGDAPTFLSTNTQETDAKVPIVAQSPKKSPPLNLNTGQLGELPHKLAPATFEPTDSKTDNVATATDSTSTYRPPPLHLYKVDPDSGVIGCICGIEEDDGFTIQCDICYRWQHCSCMGYRTNEEVPEDEYKCYYCDEKKWNKFNPATCKENTLARLEAEKAESAEVKANAGKRKASGGSGEDRKKRKTEKDSKASSLTSLNEVRPGTNKRKSSTNLPAAASAESPSHPGVLDVPLKNNHQLEDGVTAESYQSVYYKLKNYDYKIPVVKRRLELLGAILERNQNRSLAIEIVPLALYKTTKFSKVILPTHQRYLQDNNEIRKNKGYNKTSVQVKSYSDNPKQKFTGINKVGLYITDRSATAGVDTTIPAGTTVIEYLGEIDFLDLYKANHANQYSLWGTVKPKVSMVNLQILNNEEPLSIVIDSRFVGTEARFIRKACPMAANCEIKPIYIPQLNAFKFIVVTSKPITLKGEAMEEELRLPWEWDPAHPIKSMLQKTPEGEYKENKKFEDFNEDEKFFLISCVDAILNFTECGCNTSSSTSQCSIFKIKKATSYLQRSTRKASGQSNASLSKTKEVLMTPNKVKEFVSWKERLVERDGKLHSSIFSLTPSEESSDIVSDDERSIERSATPNVPTVPDESSEPAARDKTGFFRQPFKKQLVIRGQSLAKQCQGIVSQQDNENGELTSKTTQGTNSIAVPIMPEILSLIRESVNEKLKPLAKITSDVRISVEPTDQRESTNGQEKENKPVRVGVVPSPQEELIETAVKTPTVVKKLSFADYKKKMK